MIEKGIFYGILFAIGLILANCTNRNGVAEYSENKAETPSSTDNTTIRSAEQEDFDYFYTKFLADSLFQISRIKFPLKGKKVVRDQAYEWSLANWAIMKASIYEIDTTEYKVEIERTDTHNSFRIFLPNSGFDFEMKFELIDHKWYLVYCKDVFS